MEKFEATLANLVKPELRRLLGALVVVAGRNEILYEHAAGTQSLDNDSPALKSTATLELGSAGKFLTNIAALKCVEQGLVQLDEPLTAILPELDELQVISKRVDPAALKTYSLLPAQKKITLRHLLLHTSGISSSDNPLVAAWEADQVTDPNDTRHKIVQFFSMPLLFEPGEGWAYGSGIYWTDLLLFRLTNRVRGGFTVDNIFTPLNMTMSSYQAEDNKDILNNLLEMVERDGDALVKVNRPPQALVSNAMDLVKVFQDLMSPTPTILSKSYVDLLMQGHFGNPSPSLSFLRSQREDYAKPAGIPDSLAPPLVNWSPAGLVAEETFPLSLFPPDTVTWNGMPNVIWAVNREKGLAMVFATQLLPVDDPVVVDLAMLFFRCAWKTFGPQ